ncbi:MAG: alkaline phosphatase [Deltaproteobacteria bacterium]
MHTRQTSIFIGMLAALGLIGTSPDAAARAPAADPTWQTGAAELASRRQQKPDRREARNLILFIADGNGVNSVTATRIFAGQEAGGSGEEFDLAYDKMPWAALVKTYNTDAQVPDSAGTATALLAGVKTRAGVIGVDSGLKRGDCAAVAAHRVPSLFDLARERGWARGIVTTTRLTHATPAAAYAASADRNFESDATLPADCRGQKDIAAQLIAARLDFAMGGGQRPFLPEEKLTSDGLPGSRRDGRDLLVEFRDSGGLVLLDPADFAALPGDGAASVLGLFGASHMQFEADRKDQPSLSEMTLAAIRHLQASGKRWILLVEGGRIDHAHHATNPYRALVDGVAFSEAIRAARKATGDRTLIVVTADHSHTLSIQGYPRRGSPITGLCESIEGDGPETPCLDRKGKPYATLSYANGMRNPPASGRRPPTAAEASARDHIRETLIPQAMETHGGADVAAYAVGPRSYLVSGTMEQNTLFHIMGHATGLVVEAPVNKGTDG